jgi:hypothetical protein
MAKTKIHKGLWVSYDGSWGTGEVQLFDTTNWVAEDWDRLDEAGDFDKLLTARHITRKRNKQARKARLIQEEAERIMAGARLLEIRTIIIDGYENGLDDNA